MIKSFKTNLEGPISSLCMCRDGSRVAVGGRSTLKIYNIGESSFVEKCNLRTSSRQSLNFSCGDIAWSYLDENFIATASTNRSIVVWDLNKVHRAKTKMEKVLTTHLRQVNRVVFSPVERDYLLSASLDGTVKLWSLTTNDVQCSFGNNIDGIRDAQFIPWEPSQFVMASETGTISVWDLRRNTAPISSVNAHAGPVFSVDLRRQQSTNEKWIVTAGRDKLIKLWNLQHLSSPSVQNLRPEKTVQTPAAVGAVRFRNDHHITNSSLVMDFNVYTWDLRRPFIPYLAFTQHADVCTGFEWRRMPGQTAPVQLVSCGKDGLLIMNHVSSAEQPGLNISPIGLDLEPRGEICLASKDTTCSSWFHSGVDKYAEQFARPCRAKLSWAKVPALDRSWFIESARRYRLRDDTISALCEHNASVADSLKRPGISTAWRLMKDVYDPPSIVDCTSALLSADEEMRRLARHESGGSAIGENGHELREAGLTSIDTENLTDGPDLGESIDGKSWRHGSVSTPMERGTGDFFFGDRADATMVFPEFESLGQANDDAHAVPPDWTLPVEGFEPRVEILSTTSNNESGASIDSGNLSSTLRGRQLSTRLQPLANLGISGTGPPSPLGCPMSVKKGRAGNEVRFELKTAENMRPVLGHPPSLDTESLEIKEALDSYVQELLQGDVQMVVCLLLVMKDKIRSLLPLSVQERCFTTYLDMLAQFGLWIERALVIKLSHVPEIAARSHNSTQVMTKCGVCRKSALVGPYCKVCKKHTVRCAACKQPVRGLFLWCKRCSHGGHAEHMKWWFSQTPECPAGCGHVCRETP